MKITWLPDVLRNAGIKVVEVDGWLSRSHGELSDKVSVIWHHDASPPGDSPGALDWMVSNWDEASAQCWVDRYGTWYIVGCGVAWHAGQVLPGMPNNFTSIGIETDHTVDEAWPDAQLNSLRAGTAAILKYQGLDANFLNFHKVICSPPGRKQDPYGLELLPERLKVTELISGTVPLPPKPKPPVPTTPDWPNDMTPDEYRKEQADAQPADFTAVLVEGTGYVVPRGTGKYEAFSTSASYTARKNALKAMKFKVANLPDNSVTLDQIKALNSR